MCESVGAGVVSIGSYYMSLDTAAWIAGQTDTPFFDAQRRLGHICSLDGRSFSVFGAMRCAGKCVNWAQKIFDVGSPRAFDAAASNIPAGADGLVFLPYLEGERSPIYDEQAQGVFFGMTQEHRREHFLRAVLEGVGCGLSQILDVLRERDEISDLHIIGGRRKIQSLEANHFRPLQRPSARCYNPLRLRRNARCGSCRRRRHRTV